MQTRRHRRRRPSTDQAYAVVNIGEIDVIASRALDRRLPLSQLGVAASHDRRARGQIDGAPMGYARLDQLEPERSPRARIPNLEIGLQRQIAHPVRLHPSIVNLGFVGGRGGSGKRLYR